LRLPVRPPKAADAALPAFGPPVQAASIPVETTARGSRNRLITHDVGQRSLEIRDVLSDGRKRLVDTDLEMYGKNDDVYHIVEDAPLSATIRCERTTGLGRGPWQIRIETTSTMSADAEFFYLTNVLDAYEGDVRVFAKTRDCKIPRQLV
jgi:uncharacterized protein